MLEPGLDGFAAVAPQPSWTATPLAHRGPALAPTSARIFSNPKIKTVHCSSVRDGIGFLFNRVSGTGASSASRSSVSGTLAPADFGWSTRSAFHFAVVVRSPFRCTVVTVCDPEADQL